MFTSPPYLSAKRASQRLSEPNATTAHCDVTALRGQRLRKVKAKPAERARNQNGLAGKVEIERHVSPPVLALITRPV
jgi:hypothetical protein